MLKLLSYVYYFFFKNTHVLVSGIFHAFPQFCEACLQCSELFMHFYLLIPLVFAHRSLRPLSIGKLRELFFSCCNFFHNIMPNALNFGGWYGKLLLMLLLLLWTWMCWVVEIVRVRCLLLLGQGIRHHLVSRYVEKNNALWC